MVYYKKTLPISWCFGEKGKRVKLPFKGIIRLFFINQLGI